MEWLPPVVADPQTWVILFLVLMVGGLVRVFVLAVMRGDLVPRKSLEDLQRERDSWRKAHEVSEQTRAIMAQQVEQLLTTGQLTNQLLTSLKESKDSKP